MDTLPLKYHPWSDRLAMDIALALEGSGDAFADILLRHNISPDMLAEFNQDSMFLKKVMHLRDEVHLVP